MINDLAGKRVAVIGTGASAIQFVPKIAPLVSELRVYQRTPQWILPKSDPAAIPAGPQAAEAAAGAGCLARGAAHAGFEAFGIGFRHPALLKQAQKMGLAHLRRRVKDEELRGKLTPDYTLGCKRVLLSNNYYRALCRPNGRMAAAVKALRGNVVIGQDGGERKGGRHHLRHRLPRHRPAQLRPHPRCGRALAGRSLGRQPAGLPRQRDRRLSQPVPGARPQSRHRPQLRLHHHRGAARLRHVGTARHAAQEAGERGGARRGAGCVQRGGAEGAAAHGVEHRRLLQLLHRRQRPPSTGFPWSTLKMRRLLALLDLGSYRTRLLAAKAAA